MSMKKILVIASTPFLNDGLTKIEMDVIEYIKNCIEVEVASGFGFDNVFGRKLRQLGVPCYKISDKRHFLCYMFDIFRIVKSNKYDKVYIHGNSAMMFFEALPAKAAGAVIVTHCHNTKTNYPIIHYTIKPFFNLIVDEKIGCSSAASKWAYSGNGIKTINNGIDIVKFQFDMQDRLKIRKDLEWENKKIIGHVGRFNRQKNHLKLLNVFGEMYKKDQSCRLLLIGDGELKNRINSVIRSNNMENLVKIIPFTEFPQKFMSAMDIMIIPSIYEGLCLVALEAQANGLPVLISDTQTPETVATDIAYKNKLDENDMVWASEAFRIIKQGRKNVTQQLIHKKFNYDDMLEEIKKILLK